MLAYIKKFLRVFRREFSFRFIRSSLQHSRNFGQYKDSQVLVYYGDQNSHSHFRLWNRFLNDSGVSVVSVFRQSSAWKNLDQDDKNQCVPIATQDQLEKLIAKMPKLRAILYPSNNGVNINSLRHSKYNHIFIGHGDSFKSSSASKFFRCYDEIWVAGNSHIRRFDQINGDFSSLKFVQIGQPWMKDQIGSGATTRADIRGNIGYFPTWNGNHADTQYSSLPLFPKIAACVEEAISKQSKFIVKLHPWATRGQEEMIRKTNLQNNELVQISKIKPLKTALDQELSCIITDNSAALVETLHLDVPIILYRSKADAENPNFQTNFDFCYTYETPKQLSEWLGKILHSGEDPLATKRGERLNDFVNQQATLNDQFRIELLRVSEQSSET